MTNSPEILFLLVGRGGSKGLPGKNLREVGGLSLVGYKAKAARQSRYCSRLIVSSDSAEIRAEAARHGVEVLFDRPAELASDTADLFILATGVTFGIRLGGIDHTIKTMA